MKYNLSEREIDVLLTAWAHCAGDGFPKIDYPKLAEHIGLKNAASATTAYCSAKKKILAQDPNANAGEASAPTPKAAGGKKRKSPTAEGDEAATPKAKKARGKKAKAGVEAKEETEEDQDVASAAEEEMPIKGEAKDEDDGDEA